MERPRCAGAGHRPVQVRRPQARLVGVLAGRMAKGGARACATAARPGAFACDNPTVATARRPWDGLNGRRHRPASASPSWRPSIGAEHRRSSTTPCHRRPAGPSLASGVRRTSGHQSMAGPAAARSRPSRAFRGSSRRFRPSHSSRRPWGRRRRSRVARIEREWAPRWWRGKPCASAATLFLTSCRPLVFRMLGRAAVCGPAWHQARRTPTMLARQGVPARGVPRPSVLGLDRTTSEHGPAPPSSCAPTWLPALPSKLAAAHCGGGHGRSVRGQSRLPHQPDDRTSPPELVGTHRSFPTSPPFEHVAAGHCEDRDADRPKPGGSTRQTPPKCFHTTPLHHLVGGIYPAMTRLYSTDVRRIVALATPHERGVTSRGRPYLTQLADILKPTVGGRRQQPLP